MAEKQVAIMKLKVDLQCDKCYMKVKKVLCKFPQIRDQIYDEKHDTVTIKVVCCSPEWVRDKLCCSGGGAIKSIEIVEISKPKPPQPPPGGSVNIVNEATKPPGDVIVVEQPPKLPKPTHWAPVEPEKPKPEPKRPASPPWAPLPELKKQDEAAKPPPPAVKFPEPVPVSVIAYPSPAASVGRGLGWPTGYYYGRPIYDSYGWSGPSYVGYQYQNLWVEEEESMCTIA